MNRLQAFAARDNAELLRHFLDVVTDDDDPGLVTEPTAVGASSGAEIFGGLMVRPAIGSFSLTVDAGVLMIVAPDGGGDDSNYKFVRDAGQVTPGVLLVTANASGSARVDVVECQINTTPEIVTDSRDVFDVTTGLFTAATVTKETAHRLTYRVRAGTPGAGFPGLSAGWLPLAVVLVPNGAANNDVATFWDVRPLVSDRQQASGVKSTRVTELDCKIKRASATSTIVNGRWAAVLNGRRVGGQLRRGTPGSDAAASIDVMDIANQGAAITEPVTGSVFLYACTPYSLPRWSRYADAPLARTPRSTKGMLVASYVAPVHLTGNPSAVIPIPASTGLTGSVAVTDAVCVAILAATPGGGIRHGHATNKIIRYRDQGLVITSPVVAMTNYDFTVPDTFWPPNAKAIYITFRGNVRVSATSFEGIQSQLSAYDDTLATGSFIEEPLTDFWFTNYSGAPLDFTFGSGVVRIPLPVAHPGAPTTSRLIRWSCTFLNAVGVLLTNGAISLYGYEL